MRAGRLPAGRLPAGRRVPGRQVPAAPSEPLGEGELRRAAEVLQAGGVVAVPTDTVYGLAADARSESATQAIFALKGRPLALELPVLVATATDALALAAAAARARLGLLAAAFWPGALTVVVDRCPGAELHLGGDPATVGLRVPDQAAVRELAAMVGPLAVTSANRHSERPCTSAEEARLVVGDGTLVLDGGRCDGQPSTVVSLAGPEPRLLRAGPVRLEDVAGVLAGAPPGPQARRGSQRNRRAAT